jgi:uncharacterized membrane protein YkvA (DUF1232 family)
MAEDPFPRERFGAMLRRMPAYLRLSWRLAKDPLLGKARRAAVVGAAGYLASPIDLVPGVVPVIGQLDDLAVALAALRLALAGLSPAQRHAHLEAAGLRDEDLTDDLRTIGSVAAWIARAGYRTSKAVVATSGRAAAAGAGMAVRTTKAATGRAAPAAKAAASKAAPAASAAGRAARDAGTRARDAGSKAAGAAGSALGRLPKRGGAKAPDVLVTEMDIPLLPPPPPDTRSR